MAKKLPIGLQDFRTFITEGFMYIDKTKYLFELCNSGKFFFLSRPRRFGKSITIATLQELYKGSRELFKGLWIEDKWDWSRKHPVIRITLTGIGFPQSGLVKALDYKLNLLIDEYGLDSIEGAPGNKLEYLIVQLSKLNKVVVLVDEYDAPIVHYLGKEVEQAYINRDILREFYTVLKNNDHLLEFVFITGVSKFSKVGIFSGLNNLQDITMHPQYATMLGYTQEELEANFSEEIVATANHMKITPEELLEKMRLWYNGYRFEENAPTVYNPVSINTFFSFQKFQNFWFATGTPSFLINLLKEEGLYDLNFDHLNPTGFDSFELDNLKLAAILYQTGYLTIKDKDEEGLLTLDYPNKEVRDAMLEHLIEGFVGVDTEFSAALIIKIRKAFQNNDIEQVIRILQSVFKGLPYFLYEKYPEKFFHAAIHLLFTYLGLRIQSEVCTSDGRVDSVVETDTHIYILEFKLDESAETALAQIRSKKYYQAWWQKGKPVVGIGVRFSSQSHNIEEWKAEEMG